MPDSLVVSQVLKLLGQQTERTNAGNWRGALQSRIATGRSVSQRCDSRRFAWTTYGERQALVTIGATRPRPLGCWDHRALGNWAEETGRIAAVAGHSYPYRDIERCLAGRCIGRLCPCLCHVESLHLAHYDGRLVKRRGRIAGVSPFKRSRRVNERDR